MVFCNSLERSASFLRIIFFAFFASIFTAQESCTTSIDFQVEKGGMISGTSNAVFSGTTGSDIML
jgi:hypothetical protein